MWWVIGGVALFIMLFRYKMDKNRNKESESQKLIYFKNDVTLFVIPNQYYGAYQILMLSGWKIINEDSKNNQVTLGKEFLNV
jgi:hypothetical protein